MRISDWSSDVCSSDLFTDAAGSVAYNKKLGQERADAVRDYLIQTGGLAANQVRAVSYGKAKNRQVDPGAYGANGEANRRVALVIDHVPPASTADRKSTRLNSSH